MERMNKKKVKQKKTRKTARQRWRKRTSAAQRKTKR